MSKIIDAVNQTKLDFDREGKSFTVYTIEGMSFNVYTKEGIHYIMWFDTVEKLLDSMKQNPTYSYHRIIR